MYSHTAVNVKTRLGHQFHGSILFGNYFLWPYLHLKREDGLPLRRHIGLSTAMLSWLSLIPLGKRTFSFLFSLLGWLKLWCSKNSNVITEDQIRPHLEMSTESWLQQMIVSIIYYPYGTKTIHQLDLIKYWLTDLTPKTEHLKWNVHIHIYTYWLKLMPPQEENHLIGSKLLFSCARHII